MKTGLRSYAEAIEAAERLLRILTSPKRVNALTIACIDLERKLSKIPGKRFK